MTVSKPGFPDVHLTDMDLDCFRRQGRVASEEAVVRDVGCEQSVVYGTDFCYSVPTRTFFDE